MRVGMLWYESIMRDIRYLVSKPFGYLGIFLIVIADTIEGDYRQ